MALSLLTSCTVMSVERTAEAAIESKKNYVLGLDRIDLGDLWYHKLKIFALSCKLDLPLFLLSM
jgi:hypothetical protein